MGDVATIPLFWTNPTYNYELLAIIKYRLVTPKSFFFCNGGRWKVCKVIYVPIPGWHNRHIMSYPLLQPRERSFV